MPEPVRPKLPLLGRLLPARFRRRVFVPAYLDLLLDARPKGSENVPSLPWWRPSLLAIDSVRVLVLEGVQRGALTTRGRVWLTFGVWIVFVLVSRSIESGLLT